MALTQLGTILNQFNSNVISIAELTGGSIPDTFAGYFFVSARNRAGLNLLSASVSVAIVSNNARIEITINPSIITSIGEDLRQVVLSFAPTNDPTTARQVALWEYYNSDQVTPKTLPATVIFTQSEDFVLSVTNSSQLPTNPVNGVIVEVTDDARYYRFDENMTTGSYPGSPAGYWVESSFDGLTQITDTTTQGCDRILTTIPESDYLPPPQKTGDVDSIPVKYLFLNGRSEGSGTIITADTPLKVQINNNDSNVTDSLSGLLWYRLVGYYRYSDATIDTSMAHADRKWETLAPISLPVDLLPGFGALYEFYYQFTSSEISQRITGGDRLSLYLSNQPLTGVADQGYNTNGDTVWNVGDKLRLLPGIRTGGQVSVAGSTSQFVGEQAYTGLQSDKADQYAFISAIASGDIRIRQNLSEKLETEALRAIISTVPANGPPSPASNIVTLTANSALNVTITNPTNGVDRWSVRSDYPDNIAGMTSAITPPRLKVWVNYDGTNYLYEQTFTPGYNSTTDFTITGFGSSTQVPLPNPPSNVGVYRAETAPVISDNGAGMLPAGDYMVYAVYSGEDTTNFLPTIIDHSVTNGCIPEANSTTGQLINDLDATLNPTITEMFLVPAVNSTVQVTLNSTNQFLVGADCFLGNGAGYYKVSTINSPTTMTIENLGLDANAIPTTQINPPTSIRASGEPGQDGISAFSLTTADFTQPAALANVVVQVQESRWLPVGATAFITIGGAYTVIDKPNNTSVTLQNTGATGNATPGTNIASGSEVGFAGQPGPQGAQGVPGNDGNDGADGADGQSAFSTLSANVTIPVSGAIAVNMVNTDWLAAESIFFTTDGSDQCYFKVTSITSPTALNAEVAPSAANSGPGNIIDNGSIVVAAALPGVDGTNGTNGSNGADATTTLTVGFTQPAVAATIQITVGSTAAMVEQTDIAIAVGGQYKIDSIDSATLVTVENRGYGGNQTVGQSVPSGGVIVATGFKGDTGSVSATTSLDLTEQGTDPAAPSAGTQIIYAKTDGNVYSRTSGGIITQLNGGAGGGGGTVIHEETVASDTSSISFSLTASDFSYITAIAIPRTNRTGNNVDGVEIIFNSDTTTANYRRFEGIINDSGVHSTSASDSLSSVAASAVTAGANDWFTNDITIVGAGIANRFTKIKCDAAASFSERRRTTVWQDGAVVTNIELRPAIGSNILAGSYFKFIGWP